MSIAPIPATRVGDLFVRQRLTGQVQLDQLALFRLQNQIATGQRIQLPSEDAPAALRAINLQRLLDRKDQIQTNIQASNSYLSAADSALAGVSNELIAIRAETVGVSGTLTNTEARLKLIEGINGTIQSLVNAGNTKLQGRYLFAGSRAQTQPYDYNDQFIEYSGNEGVLRSYVDVEQLFETNLAGTDVFGGISRVVQGADLNPQLTADTLVSAINGGQGISRNASLVVSVQTLSTTLSSVVDLSSAVTLGDVARLIEQNAPSGTQVVVDVTSSGLKLTSTSGNVGVSEVAQGRTARELGLPIGPPQAATLVGSEVNPGLLKTTPLADLVGARAQGRITGAIDDIVISASSNSTAFNGVTVEFVGGGNAGSEVVSYDSGTRTLTVEIQEGVSTSTQVAAAITAQGEFSAEVHSHANVADTLSGTETLFAHNYGAITTGGVDGSLDIAAGLIVSHGGQTVTLDTSAAETVEDLLNIFNGAELGLLAEINSARNGINVRSRLSGADLTIGENGGVLATQLGLRTYTEETLLSDFNRGLGVPSSEFTDDLQIVARDGTVLSIDLSGAATVQDVLDRINTAAGNNTGTTVIEARLKTTGNGIEIVDSSTGAGSLIIRTVEGSEAARYLGFVPTGQTEVTSTSGPGSSYSIASDDRHTLEGDSVFNTLLRLKTALEQNNVDEIGRSLERLDVDINRVNFARAEIGSRLQNIEVIDTRLKDENLQLQAALSQDMDVDLVEAISNLTARQYAFEASLRTSASLLQMTLLNFI